MAVTADRKAGITAAFLFTVVTTLPSSLLINLLSVGLLTMTGSAKVYFATMAISILFASYVAPMLATRYFLTNRYAAPAAGAFTFKVGAFVVFGTVVNLIRVFSNDPMVGDLHTINIIMIMLWPISFLTNTNEFVKEMGAHQNVK
jgi:hypothetical protein